MLWTPGRVKHSALLSLLREEHSDEGACHPRRCAPIALRSVIMQLTRSDPVYAWARVRMLVGAIALGSHWPRPHRRRRAGDGCRKACTAMANAVLVQGSTLRDGLTEMPA